MVHNEGDQLSFSSKELQDDVERAEPDNPAVDNIFEDRSIDWEGPDDPERPVNWSARKKSINFVCVWIFAFLS
jgi:hypothetical protein